MTQRWPQALPGGKAVLYTEQPHRRRLRRAPTSWSRRCRAARRRSSSAAATYGRYRAERPPGLHASRARSSPCRFDLDRLETTASRAGLEGVVRTPVTGGAQLAVSADGTLVYVPGAAATSANSDRLADARRQDVGAPRGEGRLGESAVLARRPEAGARHLRRQAADIWVYEWARDTLTQLTFDPGQDRNPVWTPDGRRIVFVVRSRQARRHQSVLGERRRHRRRHAADRQHQNPGAHVVASERQVPGLHGANAARRSSI